MAQEETNKPEEEQTENDSQGAGEPTDEPGGEEIDDGCGGNP
jgi:hypothetical protein